MDRRRMVLVMLLMMMIVVIVVIHVVGQILVLIVIEFARKTWWNGRWLVGQVHVVAGRWIWIWRVDEERCRVAVSDTARIEIDIILAQLPTTADDRLISSRTSRRRSLCPRLA